LSAICC